MAWTGCLAKNWPLLFHDQIAPIIAFHSALQRDSAVYSCLTDSSKASEKSAPSGVRPGSSAIPRGWF